MILEKATRIPGTSRREQIREISVREARLREVFRDVFRAWGRVVTVAELERAFRQRDFDIEAIGNQLERELRRRSEAIERGLAGKVLRAEPSVFEAGLSDLAIGDLAKTQVADLVVGVSDRAKLNLRSQLVQLFQSGEVTRAHLDAIGATTGLTVRQTIAVGNFRAKQLVAGASELQASRRAKAYAGRLLNLRARTIARTEAVNYTAAVVEARGAALGMVKQWVSARDADVDSICNGFDNGEKVPAGQRFSTGASRPTAHPGCRCVLEIFKEKAVRPPRRKVQTKVPVRRPRRKRPAKPKPAPEAAAPTGDARSAAQVAKELDARDVRFSRTISRLQTRNNELADEFRKVNARYQIVKTKIEKRIAARGLKGVEAGGELLGNAEYKAARAPWDRLGNRLIHIQQRMNKLKKARISSQISIIERAPADRATWKTSTSKKWKEGDELFRRLVHKDVLAMQGRTVRLEKGVKVFTKSKRGEYNGRGRLEPHKKGSLKFGPVVKVPKNKPNSLLVHEYGHALEDINPAVLGASRRFLTRRAGGDPVQRLRDLLPGHNYESWELTRADAFISPYTGKIYRDATEVVSTGLEYMAKNPLEFWQKDPDHFKYIWQIMTNNIPAI